MPQLHKTFLVVIDDDEDDRDMLSSALGLHGFNVQAFEEGQTAIDMLNVISNLNELPSLIIVDYNMPKLNGEEMLRLLKGAMPLRQVPVIIYSTSMSPIFKKALIDLGAYTAMKKSQTYQEFMIQVLEIKKIALTLRIVKDEAVPVSISKPFKQALTVMNTRPNSLFGMSLQESSSNEFPTNRALPDNRKLQDLKNPFY